ncbi:5'-nucleotidase [Cohaesibacter celericrescens]|uniref:5'-nucleotidase n=1 Tax=Cohaesibacter celericrescens TaxID=2067669 RepID=UPI00356723AD
MPYPIEEKLVIAISSSALFDLSESDAVFRADGPEAYKKYQEKHSELVLPSGVAFPFIRQFLKLNDKFPDKKPAEVVLLSRNSPVTGRRVFKSIQHYGLSISRAAFLEGQSPYKYIPAFNASLFLSANKSDIDLATKAGFPAGLVLPANVGNEEDLELRIAFDFDGVIADDQSEKVGKQEGLEQFHKFETEHSHEPHANGPLAGLFKKIFALQQIENQAVLVDPEYKKFIRTAIVTARNAPSHERMITTLEKWQVSPHETFFLGGMDKKRILEILKPHMFFDDQIDHLKTGVEAVALVHIPFGFANNK